jgi:hypothetical protein
MLFVSFLRTITWNVTIKVWEPAIVPMETKDETTGAVEWRQRLGGLLNYYYRKAA